MATELRPITKSDVVPLNYVVVRDDQDDFVAPNAITMAQVRFRPGAYDFCIWNGDARVGLLAVIDMSEYDDRSEIDAPDAGYVWRLLIGKDVQGAGHGRAAMGFAENWARARGLRLMQVQAVAENTAAIKFYESLGYTLTGEESDGELQLEKRL